GEFFAGMTIPIPLMPPGLQRICMMLPFRYTSDLPFRVYSGNIATNEALMGIALQMVWIIVLIPAGAFLMRKVIRLSVVQGG
ncbi:MAG: ABC transporter permease, partial [Herbinix sp.]|nr:ABC transporter permease [Herbinix sp.]